MASQATVLVIDDEVRSQEALRRTLEEEFIVLTVSSAAEGKAVMEREFVQVVLSDQRMPETTGIEFLKEVRERWPDVVRIIISGYTEVEDMISGINNAGIYQYILKPWHPESLLLTVRAAAQLYDLQQQTQRMNLELRTAEPVLRRRVDDTRERLRNHFEFSRITRAAASPLNHVIDLAGRVACCDIAVHIAGESGTGKELLGRAIHYSSPRAGRAFVIENCGAMSDTLLESELFGHKRGSFTGAFEDRIGLFEQADGGTIFLDEIGDTSAAFQVKLLRVLQEGEIRPVGSSRSRRVDVRIISATNRNLEEEVRQKRFREDLYYRLNVVNIHMPALRECKDDIPLLIDHFLHKHRFSTAAPARITEAAFAAIMDQEWPGNVRQLENTIERAVVLAQGGLIGPEHLLLSAGGVAREQILDGALARLIGGADDLPMIMGNVRRRLIALALERTRGDHPAAARLLGVSEHDLGQV